MEALQTTTRVTGRPHLHLVPQTPKGRRTLPNPLAYALAAGVIGLGLFASITPSPLYHTYSVLWDFSPLTLTLVYATYMFGVLASLLLVGRVSDDVGRRPVLLSALGALMVSTVLFSLADSVAWLFVARGLQGLATGAAVSAASAALLDLHPRHDPAGVGLANGVASAGGIGLGAGSVALAAGMVLIVLAAATDSSATYLIGSILGGIGFGIALLGGLRTLVAAIPADRRAAVLSAFYIVAYLSGSVPAVLAGLVVGDLGLQSTFETFGSIVAAIALVVAFEAWRTRPTRKIVPTTMTKEVLVDTAS
jgi:MFS family permease